MGNSSGSAREAHTLKYFDKLPRTVRAAVAGARFDWALLAWLRMFERGEITARALVKRINEADARMAAKERRRVWGADYPVLRGELPTARKQQPRRKARA